MVYKSKFAVLHDDEVILFNKEGDFKYLADYENVVVYIKDNALLFEGYKHKKQRLTDKRYYIDNISDMNEIGEFVYLDYYFVRKKELFSKKVYYKAKGCWVDDFAEIKQMTLIKKYLPNFKITYIGEALEILEKH